MEPSKTLSLDGFGVGFCRSYWHMIGHGIYKATREFFQEGKTLKEIYHTFITIIPKMTAPKLRRTIDQAMCAHSS